jgi:hypothetical protein
VLVPASDAVTLGATAGDPGAEAGALGGPAEPAGLAGTVGVPAAEDAAGLVDELQAVTSNAAQASPTQTATCRALRESEVHMKFSAPSPAAPISRHVVFTTPAAAPWLGRA